MSATPLVRCTGAGTITWTFTATATWTPVVTIPFLSNGGSFFATGTVSVDGALNITFASSVTPTAAGWNAANPVPVNNFTVTAGTHTITVAFDATDSDLFVDYIDLS